LSKRTTQESNFIENRQVHLFGLVYLLFFAAPESGTVFQMRLSEKYCIRHNMHSVKGRFNWLSLGFFSVLVFLLCMSNWSLYFVIYYCNYYYYFRVLVCVCRG